MRRNRRWRFTKFAHDFRTYLQHGSMDTGDNTRQQDNNHPLWEANFQSFNLDARTIKSGLICCHFEINIVNHAFNIGLMEYAQYESAARDSFLFPLGVHDESPAVSHTQSILIIF
jgi:hypothetical protein